MSEHEGRPTIKEIIMATISKFGTEQEFDADMVATNSGIPHQKVRDIFRHLGGFIENVSTGIYRMLPDEDRMDEIAGKGAGFMQKLKDGLPANLDRGGDSGKVSRRRDQGGMNDH